MISYHKGWYRLTVFLFLLAALLGTLLRFAFVVEVPGLHYKNALLSHTHLALLGWVHLTLLNFCLHYFSAEQSTNLRHRQLFVAILITTILLAVLLFVRGLDVWASPFFVIYVILNVVISVSLFRSFSNDIYRSFSGQLLSTGLLFFLLSFGGTVVLVSMVTLSAPKTMAYYLASQFFLHFQVNGWFTFGLFALFFKYLESHGISFNPQKQRQFIFLLALSTL
ncbi:MAG: hypothetical protein OEQ53_19705, partial [Saprospiraceae bacterium]|nr:hypothetical protein [Saprospiraceae bacterium]